ncbi:hypothetical protein Mlaev_00649 [Microbacterium laevaniformans]|uniref:Uncharacterized protein n=1 Tax=Microbacterium laevaniformans TaxID=36807 RepID=A0A150HID7_9MICO|nr:hypothetical protein [Microbacterium laevaniformans]KXZ61390.1 hypothetical protein Mlaev_00649 [Microbacterium laevaniformans]
MANAFHPIDPNALTFTTRDGEESGPVIGWVFDDETLAVSPVVISRYSGSVIHPHQADGSYELL